MQCALASEGTTSRVILSKDPNAKISLLNHGLDEFSKMSSKQNMKILFTGAMVSQNA